MKLFKALVIGAAMMAPVGASAQVVGSAEREGSPFAALSSAGLTSNGALIATLTGGAVLTSDQEFADIPESVFGGTFLAAGPTVGNLATFTFTSPIRALGFLVGSPDNYNVVSFTSTTGGSQSFNVTDFGLPGDGNQGLSRYLTFRSTGAAGGITSVSFSNIPAINAFETANFSVAGAVPEPATWAMMIIGFGTVGGALRRRGQVRTSVRFA